MEKNDNVGKCGHAKCAGGVLCYEKGAPMRTYNEIKAEGERQAASMEALATAKENVQWLLENEAGLADMHGLVYWAERVEALRAEIKASL